VGRTTKHSTVFLTVFVVRNLTKFHVCKTKIGTSNMYIRTSNIYIYIYIYIYNQKQ
jgi:hypothetical protein